MALSQQFYINNRKKLGEQLENDSLTIIFSGREIQMTEDANYPFFANNNFYFNLFEIKKTVAIQRKHCDFKRFM